MGVRDKFSNRYPIVAAHRGASRLAPENTICAFVQALELGAKAIELDVQMTSDGHIVVIHDLTLNRTTSGQGWVRDTTLADIRTLDAGSWFGPAFAGERVPTLDEVLSLVKGQAFVNIELKPAHLDDCGFESRVIEIVRSHQMEDDSIFMSFDHVAIQRAKKCCPDMAGVVISGARLANEIEYLRQIRADGSNHGHDWWTSQTVRDFHEAGLIAHGSLINHSEALLKALECGVDMVDSDEPNIYGRIVSQGMQDG